MKGLKFWLDPEDSQLGRDPSLNLATELASSRWCCVTTEILPQASP